MCAVANMAKYYIYRLFTIGIEVDDLSLPISGDRRTMNFVVNLRGAAATLYACSSHVQPLLLLLLVLL